MIKRVFLLLIIVNIFYTIQAQLYVVKKGAVYYDNKVVKGADVNTFNILSKKKSDYAKDKNTVYFKGQKTNYDAKTFEIHFDYLLDKKDVYVYNYELKSFQPIHSKSPKTYRKRYENIYTDTTSIYIGSTKVINSDAETLKVISDYTFYDKNNVYYKEFRLPLDVENLQFFESDENEIKYIADETTVCDIYGKCHLTDINSFEYINRYYAKDNQKVLYKEEPLKADAISFHVPHSKMKYFAQDKNYDFYFDQTLPERIDEKYLVHEDVFNRYVKFIKKQLKDELSKAILNIEPPKEVEENLTLLYTFKNSENTKIEKGKYIYMNGEIQSFIDANSFVIYNNDYAKDNNNVYLIHEYKDYVAFKIIEGIDTKTFSIIEEKEKYYAYCKDAYNVFFSLDKIDGANPKKFTFLNDRFSADKKNVFYGEYKLAGIKPIPNARVEKIKYKYYKYGHQILFIDDIYSTAEVVKNADFKNFKPINDSYALQQNKIIYKGLYVGTLASDEIIVKSDREYITTSKNKSYVYGQLIGLKNKSLLQHYGNGNYLTDGTKLYTENGKKIPKTFLKNIVYSHNNIESIIFKKGKALENYYMYDVDLASFQLFYNTDFAKDKNHVYFQGKITPYDAHTFHPFSRRLVLDKTGVYFNNERIEAADVATFNTFYDYCFDKKNFYYNGQVIPRSKVNLKM